MLFSRTSLSSLKKCILSSFTFKEHLVLIKSPRRTTMASLAQNSVPMNPSPENPPFYRRKLPETCISFSSDEGKKIFTEALLSGHMDCYFKLASQFRTQDEPAFCGLSTLVMILNALEVDPEKVWKGPWRWYHENMLDCCVPVRVVEQEGITFGQFICLAECNGLDTVSKVVDEKATEASFRDMLLHYTKQDQSLITISYSRRVLGQTGDGHFSPVGGYHPERDMVLILDTARFKYPPHWISIPLMFKAMQAIDGATGKPRGYAVLTRQPKSPHLVLFRISDSFGVTLKNSCLKSIGLLLNTWTSWLSQSTDNCDITEVTTGAVKWLLETSLGVPPGQFIFTTQLDFACPPDVSDQHVCAMKTLIQELQNNTLFKIVNAYLNDNPGSNNIDVFGVQSNTDQVKRVKCLQGLQSSHFITLFLLSWPYQALTDMKYGTNGYVLNKNVCSTISGDAKYLGNELRLLRKQFTVLLGSNESCCGEPNVCCKKSTPHTVCCKKST